MYVQNVLDQFKLKLIQMRYIQIRYIQFHVRIWRFRINRTCGDDCPFYCSGYNYHSYRRPQTTGPFFSGCNYVKIGFGRNVTTGKKTYSRLACYVFQRVQITTGNNYNQKKTYSHLAVSWRLEKITSGKKVQSPLVVGWRAKHKTQHTS